MNPKAGQRLAFVVVVDFPRYLEPTVIKNYVQMAMKKYNKLCNEANKADYFSDVGPVAFKILEVPHVETSDIREMVSQINKLNDLIEQIDR